MRTARWILCVLASCAAVAAVICALVLPRTEDASAQNQRVPITVQGKQLDEAGADELVDRFKQALDDALGGKTPPAALGAGVVAAARAEADVYLVGTDGLSSRSLILEAKGWKESNGAAYVTVDGNLSWITPADGENIESSTAMPMLLKVTADGNRWDVDSAQSLPDGPFYGSEEPQLAPWAAPWLVGLVAGLVGLGALLLLCFPRLASWWRAAIVVPLVVVAGAVLFLGSGAPSSADGGQIDASFLDTLIERPIARTGGWISLDNGSFQAYADAVHTFFWLAAALLAALALAAVPPPKHRWTAEGGRRVERAAP